MQTARELFDKADMYDRCEQINDHVSDLRLALDFKDVSNARLCCDVALNAVEGLKRVLTSIEASLEVGGDK